MDYALPTDEQRDQRIRKELLHLAAGRHSDITVDDVISEAKRLFSFVKTGE